MTQFIEGVARILHLPAATVGKLLTTIGILVVLWLLRWVWLWIMARRTEEPQTRYKWRKAATYTVTVVGLILIGRVWLEGIQSLVTYLGLVSAGVVVALREPIMNLFGWVFINWRRPFVVGDRVGISGIVGDVIDVGMSTFSLLEVGGWNAGEQSSGRIIHVPNGKVFTEPLVNYTQGFNYLWNEIPITVTFESNWVKAKAALEEIVREEAEEVSKEAEQWIRQASRRFMIRSAAVDPIVYTKIEADGVQLTIRYVCEARKRRITEQAICEKILRAFSEAADIDFAYRTSRIFRQPEEGKPYFRGPQEE